MITRFIGDNREKELAKLHGAIGKWQAQNGGEVHLFTGDNFDLPTVEELLASGHLFGLPRLLVFKDLKDELEPLRGQLAETKQTVFIFTAESAQKKAAAGNPFALADALAARDRKQLWLLYAEALRRGEGAEELFWRLWWQLKTLLLVATAAAGEDLGLKPFVENKAKRALKYWPLSELQKLATDFISLYHRTYRDSDDFVFGLEKIILTL